MLAIARAKFRPESKFVPDLAKSVQKQRRSEMAAKLVPISTLPGQCHHHIDRLTQDRSHSFAFKLDQMRKVSIDVANERHPGLFGDLIYSRNIEVMLRSESGDQQRLFSVAPGDRDREVITLKSGRYLLELRTKTSKKVDYALKLTAMKWLFLGFA
jgi:hypothetical protein